MTADLSPSSSGTSKSRSSVARGPGDKIGGSGAGAASVLSLSRSEEEQEEEWGGYHALGGLYKVRAWRTGTFRRDLVYGNTEFRRCGLGGVSPFGKFRRDVVYGYTVLRRCGWVAFRLSERFSAGCSILCGLGRQMAGGW